MTLPATDAFTAASDQALATYSASWTIVAGGFTVMADGDYVRCSSGNPAAARWNADAFNDNQYSQGVVKGPYSARIGPAARIDTGGASTWYDYTYWEVDRQLAKVVAGSRTQLGSSGPAPAANKVVRLECSGTTITPIYDGSTDASIGAQTDASISSGAAGIGGIAGADTRFDTWEGGNLAGGATGQPTIARFWGVRHAFHWQHRR